MQHKCRPCKRNFNRFDEHGRGCHVRKQYDYKINSVKAIKIPPLLNCTSLCGQFIIRGYFIFWSSDESLHHASRGPPSRCGSVTHGSDNSPNCHSLPCELRALKGKALGLYRPLQICLRASKAFSVKRRLFAYKSNVCFYGFTIISA